MHTKSISQFRDLAEDPAANHSVKNPIMIGLDLEIAEDLERNRSTPYNTRGICRSTPYCKLTLGRTKPNEAS